MLGPSEDYYAFLRRNTQLYAHCVQLYPLRPNGYTQNTHFSGNGKKFLAKLWISLTFDSCTRDSLDVVGIMTLWESATQESTANN